VSGPGHPPAAKDDADRAGSFLRHDTLRAGASAQQADRLRAVRFAGAGLRIDR
jgi:hypothetical protein